VIESSYLSRCSRLSVLPPPENAFDNLPLTAPGKPPALPKPLPDVGRSCEWIIPEISSKKIKYVDLTISVKN
jgi:hypothetical protein